MARQFGLTWAVRFAALLATLAPPAALADSLADCRQSRDPHARLAACTKVIDTATAPREQKAMAYRLRGNVRADAGALDQAFADLSAAIKLDSSDTYALIRRALVRVERADLNGAITDYSAAIQIKPRQAMAYNGRGHALMVKGDTTRALADFTRAIQVSPNSASAYNNRGLAHRKAGNVDMAIDDYTSAIAINPIYALAYNNRGYALEAAGQKMEAAADFRRALLLDPSLTGARIGLLRLNEAGPLAAESERLVREGYDLVLARCSRCHAVKAGAPRPNPRAPTFRSLHARHPAMALREPLTRGIAAPHDEMPNFRLDNAQIDKIVAFINSLSGSR